MSPAEFYSKPPIAHLHLMVHNFGRCRESFNLRFTIPQLYALYTAWMLSDWDIAPDEWEPRQVREALAGRVPTWDSEQRPTYG